MTNLQLKTKNTEPKARLKRGLSSQAKDHSRPHDTTGDHRNHRRHWEITGDYGRPWEAKGRQREATGGHRGQLPRTDEATS